MDETREEYTRRLAYNRYTMRMRFKFRLQDTDKDDWRIAEGIIRQEDLKKSNDDSAKDFIEGGY